MSIPERVIKMRKEWAESDAKRDKGLKEPGNLRKDRNIVYAVRNGWNLLDVYRPEQGDKFPVIINIHGGGYFYGDKELYRFYCMKLAQYGFAVINFDYRLSPENHFPAPLQDISSVIKWATANAEKYGFDVNNVFLIGDSAGAQLASQYAAIYSNDEYRELFDLEKDNVVIRAVCLACGMYDFKKRSLDGEELMEDYHGVSADKLDKEDKRYDVLGAVTANYPPAFIFSSKDDFLKEECEPMGEFLTSKGVENISIIYGEDQENTVGHVFHVDMNSRIGEDANNDQISFMRAHIREVNVIKV